MQRNRNEKEGKNKHTDRQTNKLHYMQNTVYNAHNHLVKSTCIHRPTSGRHHSRTIQQFYPIELHVWSARNFKIYCRLSVCDCEAAHCG